MSCFPCFSSQKNKKNHNQKDNNHHHDTANDFEPKPAVNNAGNIRTQEPPPVENVVNVNVKTFTFRELATATNNFRQETLLGEGGFGRVYRGTLQATGQVVAVKQLDRNSLQGGVDFVKEVSSWGSLDHPNLVSFIGYCADGDQRLLVYEFIPGGSVEERLRDVKPDKVAMDWVTRMKIAHAAAEALEYLHEKANPPIIYRDLKSSNVLLGEDMTPKLSHFGLSKLSGDNMTVQSRVMGTYGYCAPEYNSSGQLTSKADVYSFGVILLELITGRKVLDTTKPVDEQNLVTWAQPLFRDPKNYPDMADPFLRKRFPERGINQAVAIAAMCLQDESAARPLMSDLVTVLSFLSVSTEEKIPQTLPPAISSKLSLVIKDENFVERLSSVAAQDTYSSNSPTNHSEEDEEEEDYDSSSATSSRQSGRRDDGITVSPSQKRRGKNGKKSIGSVSRNSSKYSDCGSFSSSSRKSGKLTFSSSGRNSRKSHDSDYSEADRGEESSASLHRKSSRKSKGSKSSSRRSVEGCECSNSSKRRGRRRSSKKKGMQEGNVNSSS